MELRIVRRKMPKFCQEENRQAGHQQPKAGAADQGQETGREEVFVNVDEAGIAISP